ncbi:regulator [Skermanella stibiiresistens SB22]|uniref:Regulator n=1 Tax=Skermanella stibiiresistens SB22 TaxID=1385369 RepID=W9H9Y5_9PROT|nr:response regulator [Skermanella stibiiresistens]EWY42764.1 regulator [Skermanella stibiiresistens SB22]
MPESGNNIPSHIPGHILVADDEAIAVMALERFLSRKGYRVSTAGDGNQALEIHRRDPADVVVTDLRMPRADGHGLISGLRALETIPAIIIMTGYMSPEEEAAIPLGDRVVVMRKPIEVDRLLATIQGFTG